jgi:hypothetical protein
VKEILRQLLTGADNETHDFMRWIGLGGALTALGLQIYVVVWKSQPFDLQSFGIGMGALCASVGAALGFKRETEPKP